MYATNGDNCGSTLQCLQINGMLSHVNSLTFFYIQTTEPYFQQFLYALVFSKLSINEVSVISRSTSLIYIINYKSKFKGVLYSSYLVQVSSRYPDYDQQLTPRLFMLCYQVIRNELYFWFSIQSFHTILFSAIYKKHEQKKGCSIYICILFMI